MIPFNVQSFIDSALQLVCHDETQRALDLLNNLPAFYRDNEPVEVTILKKEINSKIFTVQDYAENTEDYIKTNDQNLRFLNTTARGQELKRLLEEATKKEIIPHIIDYGPGDYGLPLACKDIGFKFQYTPIALQSDVKDQAKQKLLTNWVNDFRTPLNQNTWFIAFEIIEHLHNPLEIKQVYDKIPLAPSKVLISTPRYTYGEGNSLWKQRGCPHLRAYTHNEFYQAIASMFKGYKWKFIDNEVMVMVGER